ncbi:MAG: hypothetical protein LBI39_03270 [Puniceicoccales bacterium]|nr:hypothetical protein [Puniceicoccales bacterium]
MRLRRLAAHLLGQNDSAVDAVDLTASSSRCSTAKFSCSDGLPSVYNLHR